MKILVTGISGYVGSRLAAGRVPEGHEVRGLSRRPPAPQQGVTISEGDVVTGAGLERALDGVDVAYYLIHAMSPRPTARSTFANGAVPRTSRERRRRPGCSGSCIWAA